MPRVTSEVRRSTRSTRYDGFKCSTVTDSKPYKSKVKARRVPDLAKTEVLEDMVEADAQPSSDATLLDTPVRVLQHIAINLCGVPPAEVTEANLLASPQEDEESSSS